LPGLKLSESREACEITVDRRRRLARLAVAAAVVAVSFSAIFVRFTTASGMSVAFYRMIFSAVFMVPVYLLRRPPLPSLKSPEARMCLSSGVFLGLHFLTWISSLKYTSVASSVALVTTQPLFVALLSRVFLGERIGRSATAAMMLALAGSIALVWQGALIDTRHLAGDLLALSGAVFVSAYMVIGRWARRSLSVESYSLLTYTSSAITIGLVCALVSPDLFLMSRWDLLMTLAMALVCTVIGHTLFNWSLEFVSASYVAVMILGEPVGASIWAALLFDEVPTILQAVACLALLSGILLFAKQERQ
jgi:drug/metabolite transporter (DMT)-like permease